MTERMNDREWREWLRDADDDELHAMARDFKTKEAADCQNELDLREHERSKRISPEREAEMRAGDAHVRADDPLVPDVYRQRRELLAELDDCRALLAAGVKFIEENGALQSRADKAELRVSALEREIVAMESSRAHGDNIAREFHEETLTSAAAAERRHEALRATVRWALTRLSVLFRWHGLDDKDAAGEMDTIIAKLSDAYAGVTESANSGGPQADSHGACEHCGEVACLTGVETSQTFACDDCRGCNGQTAYERKAYGVRS